MIVCRAVELGRLATRSLVAFALLAGCSDRATPDGSLGEASGGSGGEDSGSGGQVTNTGGHDSGGAASVEEGCRCNPGSTTCPAGLDEYCSGRPCPADLGTWLTCSEAKLLSFGQRFGYRLLEKGEYSIVFRVYGFGDHDYWAYDAAGHLVGAGVEQDSPTYVYCGEPDNFGYSFDDLGQQLSPGDDDEGAGGAGGAGGDGGAGAAGTELSEACDGL